WLLERLPWVRTEAGAYRVNRRLTYRLGDGLVTFVNDGADVRVVPPELAELPPLRGLAGADVLGALAGRFEQREYAAGETIAERGRPAGAVHLIAHGKVALTRPGEYGGEAEAGILADGRFFGERVLLAADDEWPLTYRALTPTLVLALPREAIEELTERSGVLRAHLEEHRAAPAPPQHSHGAAAPPLASGPASAAPTWRSTVPRPARRRTGTGRRRSSWRPGTTANPSCPARSSTTRRRPASTSWASHRPSCASTPGSPTSTTGRWTRSS